MNDNVIFERPPGRDVPLVGASERPQPNNQVAIPKSVADGRPRSLDTCQSEQNNHVCYQTRFLFQHSCQ